MAKPFETTEEAYLRGYNDAEQSKGSDSTEKYLGRLSSFQSEVDEAYDKGYDDSIQDQHHEDGGCWVSAACMQAANSTDDCLELKILRHFRDHYISKLVSGPEDIAEYYRIAPKIVAAINREPNSREIYDWLYVNLVLEVITFINQNKFYEAYNHYKTISLRLKETFLNL